MSSSPSTKARRVFATLLKIGWSVKRQSGSHRTLQREGWTDFVGARFVRYFGPLLDALRGLGRSAKTDEAVDRVAEDLSIPAIHRPAATAASCSRHPPPSAR